MSETPSDNHPAVSEQTAPTLLICIRDLLMGSKATAAAKAAGVAFKVVRDPARLSEVDGAHLIADLSQPDAAQACADWKHRTGGQVTGFLPHVAGDLIAAARSLGIDRVMSNGAFSGQIDAIVRQTRA